MDFDLAVFMTVPVSSVVCVCSLDCLIITLWISGGPTRCLWIYTLVWDDWTLLCFSLGRILYSS